MTKLSVYINGLSDYLKKHLGFSDDTIVFYKNLINQFDLFLKEHGRHDILSVNGRDLVVWINAEQEKNIKNNTIRRKISGLKLFYEYLCNFNHINKNPLANIPAVIGDTDQKQTEILTEEECNQLCDIVDISTREGVRDYMLIHTLWGTGIRPSEIIRLKWQDVHLDREYFLIRQGKGNKQRVIYIVAGNKEQFRRYEKVNRKHDAYPVFPKAGKEHLTLFDLRSIVKKYVDAVGIKKNITPKSFRPTFATQMYEDGVSLEDLKEILGHSTTTETSVYIHTTLDIIKKVLLGHISLFLLGVL
jgi:integrase/recombinase XerD